MTAGPGRELLARAEMVEKCRSCGTCRSVCPIFAELGREDSVARGKVALMKSVLAGDLKLTEIFDDRIQLCLNCKACVDTCPNDVRVDDLVLAARSGLVEAGRLPFVKRFVFRRLLRRGRLLPPIGRLASFFQRFVLRGLPADSPYRLLLPVVGMDRDRVFPQFAPRSFLIDAPDTVEPALPPTPAGALADLGEKAAIARRAGRVAYFAGCAANLIYPESARAAVAALADSGVEVVIPKAQGCCGTPVFNSGDFVTAREMAARNIDVLRCTGADVVVTACASCGLTLKREYEELLGFEGGVGLPVFDLTEFLAMRAAASDKPAVGDGRVARVRVTYHDPCHLVRGQGVSEEPRSLLRSIPWVEFVEMRDADRCCGCGGSFSLTHYDLAKKVGKRKAEAIRDADVEIVATECQACVMQLRDMLAQAGVRAAVISVAELLAQDGPGGAPHGRRAGYARTSPDSV
jgi:glycolate oxidase iron-sulfur subunit